MNIIWVNILFGNADGTAVIMWTRTMNVCWQAGVAVGIVHRYSVLPQPILVGGINTASSLQLSAKVEGGLTFIMRYNSDKFSPTKT